MGGGLMQLVAYGAQDIYLTGNPQITFFKVVYRRHTNFSVESIEQTFNGTADFGKKVSATIARNGDLIHRVLLEVQLASITSVDTFTFKWVSWLGERLLKYIDIEIGGQRIDRHYGEWLHIWNQLTLPVGQEVAYKEMVGHTYSMLNPVNATVDGSGSATPANTLYIPLQFWFCRNPGLALPLIALQYHEVKINIEFNELSDCLMKYGYATSGDVAYSQESISLTNVMESSSLWVDYIYLDTDERRRFAQLSHEYLIEQLQYPGEETIAVTSNKIKLAFNHPVKEIVWVVQRQDNIDAKQYFNYTTAYDSTVLSQDNTSGNELLNLVVDSIETTTNLGLQTISDRIDMGENCCSVAKLQLNGQDRFAERDGKYFNYVQPYYHHTRTPAPGINVYSFGLKPEEHQPSGTCNFSRIDNANLFITVDTNTLHSAPPLIVDSTKYIIEDTTASGSQTNAKIRIYAVNYNVLRIMSGMGGLAYSN